MAKSSRIDDQLARLHTLRAGPATPEVISELSRALGSKTNLIVAKAAQVIEHLRLNTLAAEMEAALSRLLDSPAAADKACVAKTALAKAMNALGHEAWDIYLR